MVHVMGEVKRFTGDLMYGKPVESRDGIFVYATDFDAQRLRADTAEAELKGIKESTAYRGSLFGKVQAERDAAEQRIAELIRLLSKAKLAVDDVAENCESQTDWATAESMHGLSKRINAALNPNPEAESHE